MHVLFVGTDKGRQGEQDPLVPSLLPVQQLQGALRLFVLDLVLGHVEGVTLGDKDLLCFRAFCWYVPSR